MNALKNRAADAQARFDQLKNGIAENASRIQATSSQMHAARAALDRANAAYGRQKAIVDELTRTNKLQGQSIGTILAEESRR
jgi:predicted  nucleic acid-binding Zn-ribbon protein